MKPQKPNNNIGKRIYKQITKPLNDLNLNLSHGAEGYTPSLSNAA